METKTKITSNSSPNLSSDQSSSSSTTTTTTTPKQKRKSSLSNPSNKWKLTKNIKRNSKLSSSFSSAPTYISLSSSPSPSPSPLSLPSSDLNINEKDNMNNSNNTNNGPPTLAQSNKGIIKQKSFLSSLGLQMNLINSLLRPNKHKSPFYQHPSQSNEVIQQNNTLPPNPPSPITNPNRFSSYYLHNEPKISLLNLYQANDDISVTQYSSSSINNEGSGSWFSTPEQQNSEQYSVQYSAVNSLYQPNSINSDIGSEPSVYSIPNENSDPVLNFDCPLKSTKGTNLNWNSLFQNSLDRPPLERIAIISNLASDFSYAASSFARIIISERCLPDAEKTIKRVSIGGVAGGDKYICQGILFKFALDIKLPNGIWLYGHISPRDDLGSTFYILFLKLKTQNSKLKTQN